jgi:hypothetical protein
MLFSKKSTRVAEGETIFSSLALNLKSRESRENCVRKDITLRLTRVCDNLSSADFEALVLKMTREQLRGEGAVHARTRPY